MEYGLGPMTATEMMLKYFKCLNPCYYGIWSRTFTRLVIRLQQIRLNPCFNGLWSRGKITDTNIFTEQS